MVRKPGGLHMGAPNRKFRDEANQERQRQKLQRKHEVLTKYSKMRAAEGSTTESEHNDKSKRKR